MNLVDKDSKETSGTSSAPKEEGNTPLKMNLNPNPSANENVNEGVSDWEDDGVGSEITDGEDA